MLEVEVVVVIGIVNLRELRRYKKIKKSSAYLAHRGIICCTFSEIAFLFCIVDPAFPLLKSAIVEFIVVGRKLVVGIVVMVTVCGVHWGGWEVGSE